MSTTYVIGAATGALIALAVLTWATGDAAYASSVALFGFGVSLVLGLLTGAC